MLGAFFVEELKSLSRVGTVGVVHWSPKPGRESGGSNPSPDANTKWQNGYATDCNSVYAGSIPALVSIFSWPVA